MREDYSFVSYGKFGTKAQEATNGKIRLWPSRMLVDPFELEQDDINIEDIAHALSTQTRYGGHCPMPFSIAEHCVRVSRRMAERPYYDTPEFRLVALLHDAEEAYFLDMPSPLKKHDSLRDYRFEAKRARRAILSKFGLDWSLVEHVHWADEAEYYRERREMWPEDPAQFLQPWPWETARTAFLYEFNQLQHDRAFGVKI